MILFVCSNPPKYLKMEKEVMIIEQAFPMVSFSFVLWIEILIGIKITVTNSGHVSDTKEEEEKEKEKVFTISFSDFQKLIWTKWDIQLQTARNVLEPSQLLPRSFTKLYN